MNKILLIPELLAAFALGVTQASAADASILYSNNFEQVTPGKLPEGLLIIDGAWTVQQDKGNTFLEIPGAPLDSFGLLFGPSESSNVVVSARVFGTAQGRRYPVFGVGLNGAGGYKLQVAPGKKSLDLYKADEAVKQVPFAWEPATWTSLKLEVRKTTENRWVISGKAWKEGTAEPAQWLIAFEETTPPVSGSASLYAAPISGTPIRFDDLVISRIR